MNKRIIAIILETIPALSAFISFIMIKLPYNSKIINLIVSITFLLAFFGFTFFFIGKKLDSKDKVVRVLGILDVISTIYVIVLYIVAIFSFGL